MADDELRVCSEAGAGVSQSNTRRQNAKTSPILCFANDEYLASVQVFRRIRPLTWSLIGAPGRRLASSAVQFRENRKERH